MFHTKRYETSIRNEIEYARKHLSFCQGLTKSTACAFAACPLNTTTDLPRRSNQDQAPAQSQIKISPTLHALELSCSMGAVGSTPLIPLVSLPDTHRIRTWDLPQTGSSEQRLRLYSRIFPGSFTVAFFRGCELRGSRGEWAAGLQPGGGSRSLSDRKLPAPPHRPSAGQSQPPASRPAPSY